ncbi:nuclear transport factor 2 family protein [Puniceicoccus vermicola]|uniref:Nuclear transport factor 2 family protein n=1 Tax=Puniceicoccus vermicola TaxID=388746 RepID=A0A7X1AYN2_9BACT|nr:nuclear transport factor 2 family protein [Puniceicoccus vermicola]MBC2602354.1 nuclear transport factor 2 family protein [Puniceicoccus vermicola]
MNKKLVRACESFSEGNVETMVDFISPEVEWNIVGEKTITGLEDLLQFCEEMAEAGCPEFHNTHTTVSVSQIVVEGSEQKENGVFYCDSYTIAKGKIAEIRSYGIMPQSD